MDHTCPGCGQIVSSNFEAADADDERIESVRDFASWKWQRLPDGRYLGMETWVIVQDNVLHECSFGPGGNAGDRASVPSTPPSPQTSAKHDIPSG